MQSSTRREQAAQLVAAGKQTDVAIATALKIRPETLWRWRQTTDFMGRVDALQAEMAAAVVAEGIASRTRRIQALNDRWDRMKRVIDERASDPEFSNVAGGTTGLLVHTVKMIGGGRDATTVDEYAVDTGLLKELRAHEEQAAKELGQWVEKTRGEVTGKDGGPIQVQDVSRLDDDELDALIAELSAREQGVIRPSLAGARETPASMDATAGAAD